MEQLTFKPENHHVVDIKAVVPNSWNPKLEETREYLRVKKSIELKGLRLPVIVREKEEGIYEIIDGEQRWRSCSELGFKRIWIYNEGQVSDQEAKELTIAYQQQVPFDEVEFAHLVKDMYETFPKLNLPYDDVEIKNLVDLASFNWQGQKEPSENQVNSQDSMVTLAFTVSKEQALLIRAIVDEQAKKLFMSQGDSLEMIVKEWSKQNVDTH